MKKRRERERERKKMMKTEREGRGQVGYANDDEWTDAEAIASVSRQKSADVEPTGATFPAKNAPTLPWPTPMGTATCRKMRQVFSSCWRFDDDEAKFSSVLSLSLSLSLVRQSGKWELSAHPQQPLPFFFSFPFFN